MIDGDPTYFKSPDEFRKWLKINHQSGTELWVGYFKKGTGKPSMTWPESVDEALCYGWIDGLRRRVDEERYKIRFTPRKKTSHWSDVNIKRVKELKKRKRMMAAGLAAFDLRDEKRSRQAAHEQKNVTMPDDFEDQIKANHPAWKFYKAMPDYARRASTWWVVGAKRVETRERRLGVFIDCCSKGEKLPQLRRSEPKK